MIFGQLDHKLQKTLLNYIQKTYTTMCLQTQPSTSQWYSSKGTIDLWKEMLGKKAW